jgi:RNA-directed DNA polymerase
MNTSLSRTRNRPWGLLEPDAWKAGSSGSEGAGAQQCAPATRGFHIQWRRKRGTNRWHVYTFIADRPIRSLKAKLRALTHRSSQQDPKGVLIRLNQIMRGWAHYFKHAVCEHTLGNLANFAWWRVARWLQTLHRWKWKDLRRRFTTPNGRWKPIAANGIELFNLESVAVTRYRWRGNTIPNPWTLPDHA